MNVGNVHEDDGGGGEQVAASVPSLLWLSVECDRSLRRDDLCRDAALSAGSHFGCASL